MVFYLFIVIKLRSFAIKISAKTNYSQHKTNCQQNKQPEFRIFILYLTAYNG